MIALVFMQSVLAHLWASPTHLVLRQRVIQAVALKISLFLWPQTVPLYEKEGRVRT